MNDTMEEVIEAVKLGLVSKGVDPEIADAIGGALGGIFDIFVTSAVANEARALDALTRAAGGLQVLGLTAEADKIIQKIKGMVVEMTAEDPTPDPASN